MTRRAEGGKAACSALHASFDLEKKKGAEFVCSIKTAGVKFINPKTAGGTIRHLKLFFTLSKLSLSVCCKPFSEFVFSLHYRGAPDKIILIKPLILEAAQIFVGVELNEKTFSLWCSHCFALQHKS